MQSETNKPLNQKETKINKKRLKVPNIIIVLLIMMALAMIATWILPSGEFQRETGPDGREVVVPDSFTFTENSPVNLFEMFTAIPKGLEEAGMVAFTVLIMGGAWQVINSTGAIAVLIHKLSIRLEGRETLAIPIFMILFSIIAAFIGAAELALIYIPIIMPLMIALRFDILTTTAVALVGVYGAFQASLTNPFTVGLAQNIAGLPLYSGIGYRFIVLITFVSVGIAYVVRYAKKVKKDPNKGLVNEETESFLQNVYTPQKHIEQKGGNRLIPYVLITGFLAIIYGVLALEWYMYEIGAIFFILALIIGKLGKLTLDDFADHFIEGSKTVLLAAFAIGMARSILVIIEDGQIIDTTIMGLFVLVNGLPEAFTATGIFIVQGLFNFFVSSGSGQTLITMPILSPLADLVGITKQTTVLATQLGDGISNLLFPTQGVLMASLAYSKVPYEKWLRFIFPLIIIWTVLGIAFLVIAQLINWGPF
ncbi:YfcC family protein [Alteribacillus sp. YIM 98480]|uniref:YfcC family protein n=1 Tax=Alteribacillus sp. YIM 98480 TaxID=2606599 RepID=UPI00131DF635|nr:hypothetical protein [Alteribacillus sp. YIM 98480]